jgi:hypothetical protein
VYVIPKDKDLRYLRFKTDSIKYSDEQIRLNVDLENYMWYLRDWLILPDVKLAQMQGNAKDDKSGKAGKKQKKGIKGFFKNLFKKKEKVPVDTTSQTAPIEKSEFDFDYGDDVQASEPTETEAPAKKKGVFSFLKKDKPAKEKAPKEEKPAKVKKEKAKKPKEEGAEPVEEKKEEDTGDGF